VPILAVRWDNHDHLFALGENGKLYEFTVTPTSVSPAPDRHTRSRRSEPNRSTSPLNEAGTAATEAGNDGSIDTFKIATNGALKYVVSNQIGTTDGGYYDQLFLDHTGAHSTARWYTDLVLL